MQIVPVAMAERTRTVMFQYTYVLLMIIHLKNYVIYLQIVTTHALFIHVTSRHRNVHYLNGSETDLPRVEGIL